MNLASVATTPAPAAAASPSQPAAPEYVRLSWVTGRLGVERRHELNVDFRAKPESGDSHVTMTTLKNVKVPIWFGADAYFGAENAQVRATLRDAIVGSKLIATTPSESLVDPERGELQVVYGTAQDGFQPTFAGSLKDLTPELQAVWDAAQQFMDDAKVERHVGPGNLGDGDDA